MKFAVFSGTSDQEEAGDKPVLVEASLGNYTLVSCTVFNQRFVGAVKKRDYKLSVVLETRLEGKVLKVTLRGVDCNRRFCQSSLIKLEQRLGQLLLL